MIGIIGAMEDEVINLRSAMNHVETIKVGTFEYYKGTLEGKEAVLCRCGIGKVFAAVGCAILIERFSPSIIINTGSAGGVDPALKFGDAVIADSLVYHDSDVTAFGYAPGQMPGMPQYFSVPDNLIDAAEKAIDDLKREKKLPSDFNYVQGLIGSGDVFVHEPKRIASILETFPKMKAVEMESAAIAHTSAIFNIPALIIRALSDIAGTESPMTFDQFLPIASKHSGDIVTRIVRDLHYR
jgi:adenosylhomocysteine nucleosidase